MTDLPADIGPVERVCSPEPYATFAGSVGRLKHQLRALLDDLKQQGASIAAYGGAAKGA